MDSELIPAAAGRPRSAAIMPKIPASNAVSPALIVRWVKPAPTVNAQDQQARGLEREPAPQRVERRLVEQQRAEDLALGAVKRQG